MTIFEHYFHMDSKNKLKYYETIEYLLEFIFIVVSEIMLLLYSLHQSNLGDGETVCVYMCVHAYVCVCLCVHVCVILCR